MFIGIDIGCRSLKIAVLEKRTALVLVQTAEVPLDDKCHELDLVSLLKKTEHIIPLELICNSKIAVNIPSDSVAILPVTLAKNKNEDVFARAAAEARKHMIPVSGPQHVFGVSSIGTVTRGSVSRSAVVVARTDKKTVDSCARLFGPLGAVPSIIVPSEFAVPWLIDSDLDRENVDSVFVDLGYSRIRIFISNRGNCSFLRVLDFGFRCILEELASARGMDVREFEDKFLKGYGAASTDVDVNDKVAVAQAVMRIKYDAMSKGIPADDLLNALELRVELQPYISRIVNALRSTFAEYKGAAGKRVLEDVYFLGGGACVKGFVEAISHGLRGKSKILDLAANISVSSGIPAEACPGKFASAAALAVAAARAQSPKTPVMNFFAAGHLCGNNVPVSGIMSLLLLMVLNISVVSAIFAVNSGNETARKKIRDISVSSSIVSSVDPAAGSRAGGQVYAGLLNDLAAGTPPDVFLDKLVLTSKGFELTCGYPVQGNDLPGSAGRFAGFLSESGYWKNVRAGKAGAGRFSITGEIKER